MTAFRGLYMEDEHIDYLKFKQVVERAWELNKNLSSLGNLELEYTDSPEKAIEILREKGDSYGLFIADLLYPEDPSDPSSRKVPSGLKAVELAASQPYRMVILAISVARETPEHATIDRDFLETGGDIYYAKAEIEMSRRPKDLYFEMGKKIENAFRKKKWLLTPVRDIDLRADRLNLVLQAQVETIGCDVLKELISQIAPERKDFEVLDVDPGMSGAFVFEVVGYERRPFSGGRRDLLLKVSSNRHRLEMELAKFPKSGEFSSGTCPEPVKEDVPLEADGWYAIAYAFLGRAATLQKWLAEQRPSNQEVSQFLARLFDELANEYRACRFEPERNVLDDLFPAVMFRARAILSIEELWPLVQQYTTNQDKKPDSQVVKDFIHHRRIGSHKEDEIPRGSLVCRSHGDLHGRNVLVNLDYKRPHLIDFAERGEKHWASDFAQLSASLFVRGWDHGIESYQWALFECWRGILCNWLFSEDTCSSINDKNAAIWHSLTWVRDNLQNIWNGIKNYKVSPWEFHLALACEFIKLAGQVDIPAPKRAIALITAHDILIHLESVIPWSGSKRVETGE